MRIGVHALHVTRIFDHAGYINGVIDVRGLPDGVVCAENNHVARA